jgi:hypothetical protein
MVGHYYNPAIQETEVRVLKSEAVLEQKHETLSENKLKSKRTEDVA